MYKNSYVRSRILLSYTCSWFPCNRFYCAIPRTPHHINDIRFRLKPFSNLIPCCINPVAHFRNVFMCKIIKWIFFFFSFLRLFLSFSFLCHVISFSRIDAFIEHTIEKQINKSNFSNMLTHLIRNHIVDCKWHQIIKFEMSNRRDHRERKSQHPNRHPCQQNNWFV